ncbi:MAG: serine/threonine-protein kinase [Gemmataceae bacterium]
MAFEVNSCDPDRLHQLTEGCLPAAELAYLEAHLHDCPQCQTALDQLASANPWLGAVRRYLGEETVVRAEAEPTDAGLDFLAPSEWPDSLGRIGPYEVKGLLGRGGMAVVLKAVDPALNRTVAIKVLALHLASSGAARQRFLREARAAAAVVHEHVVAVHAVEETAGLPYLVMEYVPGRSLQERLDRQGPLTLPEVLRIGMQVAAGLAAAHAQGLVHRDVKPANILLENGVERARLTDFGLARAVSDAALTQSGVLAGTPQYMAPEQARGEAVDHRSDLFSLGSTLYAMCTGHPPFRAESAVAVLRRVSDDEPRPVRELNAEVPAWLADIIATLHAKDPAQRFQTAPAVSDLLGRCLAHLQQPLTVPLPRTLAPVPERLQRRIRFTKWAMAITVLLAAAVAAPFAWRLGQQPEVEETQGLIDAEESRPARPTPPGSDEIEKQLQELRERTGSLKAALDHSEASDTGDAISTEIQKALNKAHSLEQEIRPDDMGAPPLFRLDPHERR